MVNKLVILIDYFSVLVVLKYKLKKVVILLHNVDKMQFSSYSGAFKTHVHNYSDLKQHPVGHTHIDPMWKSNLRRLEQQLIA